jgi:lipopolysaccharide transport system ATP-binding protein
MPVAIELADVTKIYPENVTVLGALAKRSPTDGFAALRDVAFKIHRGETVGLLGSNGAGKSTLLQLVAGTSQPTRGRIAVNGRVSALLELGAGFNPDWTGRRNAEFYCVLQGAAPSDLPRLIAEIEAFAEIGAHFDRPMRTYSSGMFLRVAFAAAIAPDPEIIIVDEALAVGDVRFQNKCFARFEQLKERGRTILLVTHDTVTMARFCTRGIVLKAGQVVFDGAPRDAVTAYRRIVFGGDATVSDTLAGEIPSAETSTQGVVEAGAHDAALADLFPNPPDPKSLPSRSFYNPETGAAGERHGQIVDALFLDARRRPATPLISAGRRLGIAFQVTATQRVARPCYGIVVKSRDNVYIYGVTNIMLGAEMPPVEAGETVTVCFDVDTHLARGDYFVDLGFSEMVFDKLTILEWRMSVVHFSVRTDAEIYGFADLRATFAAAPRVDDAR